MNDQAKVFTYADAAFRSNAIGPLPESPRKRTRIGEELQPVGDHAEVIPYLRTIDDVETLQDQDTTDPEFQSEDWWSDHQRLRFLNGKLGLKILIFILPITWTLGVFVGGLILVGWSILEVAYAFQLPAIVITLLVLLLGPAWMFFAFWIIPPTTNWLMSTGIGFVLKPFEQAIGKRLDASLADGCSEFNRVTGQVRLALGRGRFFQAPFVEFDAYVERVIQQGGIFYRLMLVHRYTQKTFNHTAFSNIEADKTEVLALWDTLQRYMDVTQPLPDIPSLEPFRHLDPVTAEHDRQTGRNPRFWRDLDLEAWKEGEGLELLRRQREFPWGRRVCKLTPKLGQIDMATYRQQRPETASVI
jgi:hypothetical protein